MARGWPALQRLSSSSSLPRLSLTYPSASSSSALLHPLRGRSSVSRHPWLRFRRCPPPPSPQTVEEPAGGVTNQRLAIVNSTCAVKQLINKRLFTSCARSCFTRFIIIRGTSGGEERGEEKEVGRLFRRETDTRWRNVAYCTYWREKERFR